MTTAKKLGRFEAYSADRNQDLSKGTMIVGRYRPNAWGLYDMHGNLWEFCLDWMAPYDLKDNVDPKGPKEGRFRVLRGGSWFDRFVRYNRSAFRHFFPVERRDWSYGCRLTIQSR